MRAAFKSAALVLGLAAAAFAQDVRQPADWKKMYDDASAQLRAAQDRKSELAADNAKLTAQVAELQRQLQTANQDAELLRRQADGLAQELLLINAFYSTWGPFSDPAAVSARSWQALAGRSSAALGDQYPGADSRWPLLLFP
ncbi:MAG: hypothetical protein ABSH22_13920 [Tepidisphaeraceae bacterium]|jgi:uncharacterized protein YigA (DUF484 family)